MIIGDFGPQKIRIQFVIMQVGSFFSSVDKSENNLVA
jgi:hypothetical protein